MVPFTCSPPPQKKYLTLKICNKSGELNLLKFLDIPRAMKKKTNKFLFKE